MSYNSSWTGPQIDDAVGKALVSAKQTDLTSIVATGSTNATGSRIASGTYFYLNGTLVRAKANIASGATFTSSNYEAVTAGGLNELKAALDAFPKFIKIMESNNLQRSTTLQYTGLSVTIPAGASYVLSFMLVWNRSESKEICVSTASDISGINDRNTFIHSTVRMDQGLSGANTDSVPITFYLYGRWVADTINTARIRGFIME